jgi:glycosyltransferase involved in cell wall biosynthesis
VARDPVLRELCSEYAAELLAHGYEQTIGWPYSYAATASGLRLDRPSRRLYLAGLEAGALDGALWDPPGAEAFEAYARGPAGVGTDPRISRYMAALRALRPDLQAAFPALTGREADGFVEWVRERGPEQLGDAMRLTGAAALERPAPAHAVATPATPATPAAPATPRGVNLAGYLRAELGVGEVARQVTAALDAHDEPVLPLVQVAEASRQGHAFAAATGAGAPFPINLLCINADQTAAFAATAGPDFFAGRHTIGWWWWEVSSFPRVWDEAFDHVDEIWAGSRFVAETLQRVAPVPVIPMPLPVSPPQPSGIGRAELGLPPDAFTFLYAFDFHSVFARKNPLDAIAAFARAFAPGEGPVLVLKSINGDAHPDHAARIRDAVGERPDILVMDRYLSAPEKDALVHACDAYVSLHRSEGFGITIAEAMALGKPAIATRYSGNLDFMTDENAYLVDAELVPIGPGSAPYPPDGEWAQPDVAHAAALMRRVVEDPAEAAAKGRAAAAHLAAHHSHQAAGELMVARLTEIRRRLDWPDPGAYARQARSETADLIDRGIARSTRRRVDPRRVLRGLAVRAAQPLLAHQRQVHRALLFSLEESVAALRHDGRLQAARIEARELADRRRMNRLAAGLDRLGSGLGKVTAGAQETSRAVDAASAHLAGLQAFADRADPLLSELDALRDAAAAEPFMTERFATSVHPVAGRVIGYDQGRDPAGHGYLGFEDVFRGPEELIRERQRRYLPLLRGHAPVLDAGCGRGEMLDLLREEGVEAIGVDLDPQLVEHCRGKGHENVEVGDVVDWLAAAPDASLGAVFSAQVVEHLPVEALERLLGEARRALRPDGVFIAETVNPTRCGRCGPSGSTSPTSTRSSRRSSCSSAAAPASGRRSRSCPTGPATGRPIAAARASTRWWPRPRSPEVGDPGQEEIRPAASASQRRAPAAASNRSRASCRATAPSRSRRGGSAASAASAPRSCATARGRTRSPDTPSRTTSPVPPTSVATMARPSAAAHRTVVGRPSV